MVKFDRINFFPLKNKFSSIDIPNLIQDYVIQYEIKDNYDILISPSHHEGFSRIVLEGAYIGLYCIGNNIPGQKEIIKNTECGELIDNNDIELYINSFEDIDKKIERLDFEFTRNQIENNYSVNAISEKFEEIYR